jgi:hypothetical protein
VPRAKTSERHRVLIYGFERKGFQRPGAEIGGQNWFLEFGGMHDAPRFQEFDGVILFQGIFERFEPVPDRYCPGLLRHECDDEELDRRTKELWALFEKGGLACFLLCQPFIDFDEGRDFRQTDLSKRVLQDCRYQRVNFDRRLIGIRCHLEAFRRFFELYAGAFSSLESPPDATSSKRLGSVGPDCVAAVSFGRLFFLPTLLPKRDPGALEEYLRLLVPALVSTWETLRTELPGWIAEFRFEREKRLLERRTELLAELTKIDGEMAPFEKLKGILAHRGEPLVDAVCNAFEQGLDVKVRREESFREDMALVDGEGRPIALVEVKGVAGGVQREHVNQADNHRERAGLPVDFPSLLIINTDISKAASMEDKVQPVAREQVEHAARNNVLIIRTIDLLFLIERDGSRAA